MTEKGKKTKPSRATKTQTKKAASPQPPRERLTDKAKWAIVAYVKAKLSTLSVSDENRLLASVTEVLKAERMKRETLYQWLEGQGYRWSPKTRWVKSKK